MKYLMVLAFLLMSSFARAVAPNSSFFVYEGTLTDSSGAPLVGGPYAIVLRIGLGSCVLYQESHSVSLVTADEGRFSLFVGKGSLPAGNTAADIFGASGSVNCVGGGSITLSSANRVMEVSVDGNALTPAIELSAVPLAHVALNAEQAKKALDSDKLGGVNAADFAKTTDLLTAVPANETDPLVKPFAKSVLPTCNPGEVLKADGASFSCVPDSVGAAVAIATSAAVGTVMVPSASNVSLAADGSLDVKDLAIAKITGLQTALDGKFDAADMPGASCAAGEALVWQSPSNSFACYFLTLTASQISDFNTAVDARITPDATKLPLAGGTMTGDLNMGSKDVLATGHITMSNQKTITVGKYDQAQENTLAGPLTGANEGAAWYNSAMKALRFWDGTARQTVVSTTAACADGQLLKWNDTTKVWYCAADAGAGGADASSINGVVVNTTDPTATGQVLRFNSVSGEWEAKMLQAADLPSGIARSNLATGSANHVVINDGTTGVLSSEAQLAVSRGGTGQSTYTDGQILIGKSDGTLAKANITAGTGITVTNGNGTISIAASATGDNLGNHVATLDLNMNGHAISSVASLAGNGALSLSAGGPNSNITLNPTGTGVVTSNKVVTLTGLQASTNSTNGALVVTGGIGLSGNLNVGSNIYSAAMIKAATSLSSPDVVGGSGIGDSLTLESTSDPIKGHILLAPTIDGNVGIGTASPITSLDLGARKDAIRLPAGTSGERPSVSPLEHGFLRWNKDLNSVESYGGGAWKSLAPDNMGDHIATQNLTLGGKWLSGDGSDTGLQIINSVSPVGININIAPAPATPSGNVNSPVISILGNYYDGTNSVPDGWTLRNAIGNGPSPISILSFNRSVGSSGLKASYAFMDARMGIGTGSPKAFFHVSRTILPNGTIDVSAVSTSVTGNFTNFKSALSVDDQIIVNGEVRTISAISNDASLTVSSPFSSTLSGVSYNRVGAIFNAGYVGVGTQVPKVPLDVAGPIRISTDTVTPCSSMSAGAIRYDTGSIQFCNGSSWQALSVSGGSPWISGGSGIYYGNKVGIGISNPLNQLHVVGASGATVALFSDGTQSCSITPSTAGNVTCSSDERLKKNIEPFSDATSLENILKLQTVTYEWNNVDNGRHTGYIAQEIEKIAPEFVRTGEDGYKQVSYVGFIPWITGAIKELYNDLLGVKAENEIQARQIASKADKETVEALKAKSDKLEVENKAKDQKIQELEQRLEKIEKVFNAK